MLDLPYYEAPEFDPDNEDIPAKPGKEKAKKKLSKVEAMDEFFKDLNE